MLSFRKPDAVACVCGKQGCPAGMVRFFQDQCGVTVEAEFSELPENDSGFFGLHIHEGRGCGGEGFSRTGSHYDPEGKPHPMHAGDLPPLLRRQSGRAYLKVCTDRFRLCQILGRTVVLHTMADDFRTQPAGDAGEKLACGVICPNL